LTSVNDILNAFTVDVEDYFQVSAFEPYVRRSEWNDYPSRVVANTHRLLNLLETREVHGTFFVLGWVANRFPQLVRDIQRQGHEVASHGYWHRLIYDQTPDEFRQDIRRSRDVLEQITGTPVVAYRAPSFSITNRSLWALNILVEEGFSVDSSIFPVRHDRYGIPDANREIRQIETSSGALVEFPPSVLRVAGMNVPIGGGYFRLYPWQLTNHCLRGINRRDRVPFMFYTHPWEIDPTQPRVACGSRARFRHYLNLDRTESRLIRILDEYRFSTVSAVMRASLAPPDLTPAELP